MSWVTRSYKYGNKHKAFGRHYGMLGGEVAQLVASLGGDSRVLGFRDVRYAGFTAPGAITTWPDVRGAALGLPMTGTATLVGTDPSTWYVQTYAGNSDKMVTATDARYDLSTPKTICWIGYMDEGGGTLKYPYGMSIGANTALLAFDNNEAYVPVSSYLGSLFGAAIPGAPATVASPERALTGRVAAMFAWRGATTLNIQVPPLATAQTTGLTTPTTGNGLMSLGVSGLGNDYVVSRTRAMLELSGTPSAADITAITTWAQTYHGATNDINAQGSMVVFDGDSITAGSGALDVTSAYPSQVARRADFARFADINVGVPGVTITQMITSAPTAVDPNFLSGRLANICVIFGGTNDINAAASAATTYSRLQTYCAARKAVGWTIVAVTMLPRTGVTDSIRISYNSLIRAGVGVDFDVLADVGGNALIGAPGANLNTALSADGTHPTPAAYGIVAQIIGDAIQVASNPSGTIANVTVTPTTSTTMLVV